MFKYNHSTRRMNRLIGHTHNNVTNQRSGSNHIPSRKSLNNIHSYDSRLSRNLTSFTGCLSVLYLIVWGNNKAHSGCKSESQERQLNDSGRLCILFEHEKK